MELTREPRLTTSSIVVRTLTCLLRGPPANDAEDSPGPSVKVRDMRGSDPHAYGQLGLLRQPSGTEPAAEHRRRIDTNEATLASQLLRLKDGMAAEAQEQDEQHTLVLTAVVDVQDTLTVRLHLRLPLPLPLGDP